MCGIAGRFNSHRLPADPTWHQQADTLLAHRGPDGNGYFADDFCELIHRRLAIIDLSPSGLQPMTNENGSVYIVYNGEIYNFRELKLQLEQRGHLFRSASDTEVLVHLYEEYGADLTTYIQGMFAFAIYDVRQRRLLLARDRFGIKPLYYTHYNGSWAFASEIKALLALDGFVPQLDRQACYDFLSFGYIPEPATGFANILALPKASSLIIQVDGCRLQTYYRFRMQADYEQSIPRAADAIAVALESAVKRQKIADVPVAALLSGGIDSSLVVAASQRGNLGNLRTFNVRFPDQSYDETRYALATARHCQTEHMTIDLTDWKLQPEEALDLLGHFDQPYADTSLLPTFQVFRAIRESGITCVLTGDGGDEAFGGYNVFSWMNRLRLLLKIPRGVQNLTLHSSKWLAVWNPDISRQTGRAIDLIWQLNRAPAAMLAALVSYVSEGQKQDLVQIEARYGLLPVERLFESPQLLPRFDLENYSQQFTQKLFDLLLPGDMLRKTDMMSMKNSLEVRVPLLDEQVIQVAASLPHALKVADGKTKAALRALASRWLPSEVAGHRKQGFGIPLDIMVTRQFYSMLDDCLLSSRAATRSMFNQGLVEDWLKRFQKGDAAEPDTLVSREGLNQRIFFVLALELWLSKHHLTW